eukprot:CAMPEP_0169297088 /NCGR_PEP_ID=MMETSP1016-20121227/65511_1 /TAXON_ID=342587 /ORGANISM="Karlodinium micrum, Strain CCMP2283" /LENGTH=1357 /DNA_ID=CAMNT_0009388571 /DNA_START=1 /DNA_END=4071 /DNA_ORIENTATION=+
MPRGALDLKELFEVDRWRLLHADDRECPPPCTLWHAAAFTAAGYGEAEGRNNAWRHFPDPAGLQGLRWRAEYVANLLEACGQPLQKCKREAASSRSIIRDCRADFEHHSTTVAAMRLLLSDLVPGNSRGSSTKCIGKVRCYFCRERIALDRERLALEAENIPVAPVGDFLGPNAADISSSGIETTSSAGRVRAMKAVHQPQMPHPPRRRRRTSRQRGKAIYKSKDVIAQPTAVGQQETWFAKNTEEPQPGGVSERSVSGLGLPQRSASVPAPAPLSPYMKAAGVFWKDFMEEFGRHSMRSPLEKADNGMIGSGGSACGSEFHPIGETVPSSPGGAVHQPLAEHHAVAHRPLAECHLKSGGGTTFDLRSGSWVKSGKQPSTSTSHGGSFWNESNLVFSIVPPPSPPPSSEGTLILHGTPKGSEFLRPSNLMPQSPEAIVGKATIDGVWTGGTISGTTLTWPNGTQTTINMIAPREYAIMLEDDKVLTACLEYDGKLHWTDGDVWEQAHQVEDRAIKSRMLRWVIFAHAAIIAPAEKIKLFHWWVKLCKRRQHRKAISVHQPTAEPMGDGASVPATVENPAHEGVSTMEEGMSCLDDLLANVERDISQGNQVNVLATHRVDDQAKIEDASTMNAPVDALSHSWRLLDGVWTKAEVHTQKAIKSNGHDDCSVSVVEQIPGGTMMPDAERLAVAAKHYTSVYCRHTLILWRTAAVDARRRMRTMRVAWTSWSDYVAFREQKRYAPKARVCKESGVVLRRRCFIQMWVGAYRAAAFDRRNALRIVFDLWGLARQRTSVDSDSDAHSGTSSGSSSTSMSNSTAQVSVAAGQAVERARASSGRNSDSSSSASRVSRTDRHVKVNRPARSNSVSSSGTPSSAAGHSKQSGKDFQRSTKHEKPPAQSDFSSGSATPSSAAAKSKRKDVSTSLVLEPLSQLKAHSVRQSEVQTFAHSDSSSSVATPGSVSAQSKPKDGPSLAVTQVTHSHADEHPQVAFSTNELQVEELIDDVCTITPLKESRQPEEQEELPRRSRATQLPSVARARKTSKELEIRKVFEEIGSGAGTTSLSLQELRRFACDHLGFGMSEMDVFFQAHSVGPGAGAGVPFDNFKTGYASLNPFMVSKRKDEIVMRKPKSLHDQQINLEDLDDCEVYVCDLTEQVFIDACKRCLILLAPCNTSVFVRDCEDSVFWIATKQFRTRNCQRCTFHLYSKTEPIIEMSSDLVFGPWCAKYPKCTEHFSQAGFDPEKNLWNALFDFSGLHDRSNWSIIRLSSVVELTLELDEPPELTAPPDNPVPEVTHAHLTASPLSSGHSAGQGIANIPQTRPPLPLPPKIGEGIRRQVIRDGEQISHKVGLGRVGVVKSW